MGSAWELSAQGLVFVGMGVATGDVAKLNLLAVEERARGLFFTVAGVMPFMLLLVLILVFGLGDATPAPAIGLKAPLRRFETKPISYVSPSSMFSSSSQCCNCDVMEAYACDALMLEFIFFLVR